LTHVITISIRNTKVKKRNLILQAAVAGLFCAVTLSANASGSTANAVGNSAQIATQAVTATSIIGSGSLTYTVSGVIPAGSYYVYVQLGSSATFYLGSGTPNYTVDAAALTIGNLGGGTASVGGTGTILSGATNIVAFPVTVSAAIGPNATFTFKPVTNTAGEGGIAGAASSVVGGSLSATMSLGAFSSYSSSLTAIVTDEAQAATAPIATFVNGLNAAALSSGSFGSSTTAPSAAFAGSAEKALINVLGGATGVSLTGNVNVPASTELLDLGGFYFVDVSTNAASAPPFGGNASSTFNIANDYAGGTISGTITAPTGFFNVANQTGGQVFISTASACSTSSAVASIATGGATATFSLAAPAGTAVSATDISVGIGAAAASKIIGPLYVCVQAPATNATQWVSGTPSLVASLAAPTINAVSAINIAATPLYDLLSNGGSAYVREYIPASVQGYTTFIRVINTGSVAANINAAIVSDVTGKTGVQGVVATAVPPNGAVTLSSSQIEAAIVAATGVAPAGTAGAASGFRPRLFVSAPTTIAVQSFISDANGNFSEVSGGNVGNIAPGSANINPFNQ